ncbi:hypothetical protein GGI08_008265, partial [Coemansia sp. S2]
RVLLFWIATDSANKENVFPAPFRSWKTKQCWAFKNDGACAKGDACTFAHGLSELRERPNPPNRGTVLCRNIASGKQCPYYDCDFSHDVACSVRPLAPDNRHIPATVSVSTNSTSHFSQASSSTHVGSPNQSPHKSAFTPYEHNSPNNKATNIPDWSPQKSGRTDTMVSGYEVYAGARWHSLISTGNSVEATYPFSLVNGPGYDGLLAYLCKEDRIVDGFMISTNPGARTRASGLHPRRDDAQSPTWSRLY